MSSLGQTSKSSPERGREKRKIKSGFLLLIGIFVVVLISGCASSYVALPKCEKWERTNYEVQITDVYWTRVRLVHWQQATEEFRFYTNQEPSYDQYGRLIILDIWKGAPRCLDPLEEPTPSRFQSQIIFVGLGPEDRVNINKTLP